jgi:hypothetical protein
MQDHLSGRQFRVLSAEESRAFNERLDTIVVNFGSGWLGGQNQNPLQELWARKDALATYELISLGDALYNLLATNPEWTRNHIKEIKFGNPSNRNGAILELLGLNLFHCRDQRVQGAPKHNPGYDGIVTFGNGSTMLLSVKNHGISWHDANFQREASRIDQQFRFILKSRFINGVEIFARARVYPTRDDWMALRDALELLIIRLATHPGFKADIDTEIVASVRESWTIRIRSTPKKYKPLFPLRLSAGVQISAPYHQNEHKNFWDSIRKDCFNLSKHAANASGKIARALLIRLSSSAVVGLYTKWLGEYFKEYPEEPIEFIFLYQTDVIVDLSLNEIIPTHYLDTVESPRGKSWAHPGPIACVNNLLGRWIEDPPLSVGDLGENTLLVEGEFHRYQNFDVYRWFRTQTEPIEVRSPGTGANIHSVVGEGSEFKLVSLLTPPQHRLALLP